MKGPAVDGASYERPGSTVHSFAGDLPIAQLPKGDYRVEVQATDSADHSTPHTHGHFHNRNSDSGQVSINAVTAKVRNGT